MLAPTNEETESPILRSIVVTGASRGIGEAVTKTFLTQGDRVMGISRSGKAPDGALTLVADVIDPDTLATALTAATETHGPIEILTASTGVNRESLAARTSPQMRDEVISVDLTDTFNTAHVATPAMMRARKGHIVLVSSATTTRGGVGLLVYDIVKGGVEGLARSLTHELASRGVTVNTVTPGFVTTAMTASPPNHIRTAYLEQIPLGCFADVTDVVGPVLFLASSTVAYVTGVTLGVDGGLGIGRWAHDGERDVVGTVFGRHRDAVG